MAMANVLVIEDDDLNQFTIKKYLDEKFNPIITDSADGAHVILQNNKIDLILMDISISGERHGLELTAELKASKNYSQIPIIAVTAHASEKDRINSFAAGCDDYIAKPFRKSELLLRISKFLEF